MDEALKMADSIVLMRDGKLLQVASPEDMLRNPANDYVVSFIGLERSLRSPDEVLVEEIMIPNPVSIEINRGLAEGLERMRKRRVDSLMVVEADHHLSGIVTIKDIQQNMAKGGRIGGVMSVHPTTAHIGNTVREAVLKMSQKNVGYLPVIDDHNKLKGLITRASLVNVLSDVLWNSPDTQSNGSVPPAEPDNKNKNEQRKEVQLS